MVKEKKGFSRIGSGWKLFAFAAFVLVFCFNNACVVNPVVLLTSISSSGVRFFEPQPIKVLVIGESSSAVEALLTSEDYRVGGISYVGSLNPDSLTAHSADAFKDYILILQRVGNSVRC